MYIPNNDVYAKLKNIDGVEVYYNRPEIIPIFPSITYYITNNSIIPTLEGEIGYQTISITVDIWATTLKESNEILDRLESEMRSMYSILDRVIDIPEPNNKDIIHKSCLFNLIN